MTDRDNNNNHKKKKSQSRRRRTTDLTEDDPEHERETKRLRTFSQDGEDYHHHHHGGEEQRRRRTRSMDKAEEEQISSEPTPKIMTTAQQQQQQQQATTTRDVSSSSSSSSMSPDEWRKEHGITIRGHGTAAATTTTTEFPAPFVQFRDAPFHDRIQQAFVKAGFAQPTAIQSQAWPIALTKSDMICIAKTGSGKTCGFLLPAFHQHLEQNERRQGYTDPVMLVLAPTRELSVQIMEEAQRFGRMLGIRTVCCYGGSSKYAQISALSRGVEIVIATPGRLNDLLSMTPAVVNLSKIQFLVLDEADRMLDMGFEPQIRSIVEYLPKAGRQTLLFSATWPREIQTLAHDFLQNPIQINVGEVNALVANKDIEQVITVCREDEKFDKLTQVLNELMKQGEDNEGKNDDEKKETGASHHGNGQSRRNGGNHDRSTIPVGGGKCHGKVIVFVAKKISCHELANRLWDDGFAVDSLHGDRPQWERTKVMHAFKRGQLLMLIATDVAARGLDVKDVQVVVNYDMPSGVNAVEDYVHRIGRTGRAGAKGMAYTFFTYNDKKSATKLVQVLEKAEQTVPPELQAMVPKPRFSRGGGGGRGGSYHGRNSSRGRGYMSGGGGRGYMSSGGGGGGRGYGGGGGRGYGGGGGRGYGGGGRGGRSSRY